jgi:hypothetical protein
MSRKIRISAKQLTVTLAVVAALTMVAWQVALHRIEGVIVQALGAQASVGAIDVGFRAIEIRDLRVRGLVGWPAEDELRAQSVRLIPDPRSALYGDWRLREISFDHARVSVQRTVDGRMLVMPSLLLRSGRPGNAEVTPTIVVDQVKFIDSVADFYDATLPGNSRPLAVEKLKAEIGPLHLPALDDRVALKIDGRFHGPNRDGAVRVVGSVNPTTRAGHVDLQFRNIDLVALQPYLFRSQSAASVRDGWVDLTISADVEQRQLHAPGAMVLAGLNLADEAKVGATFGGVKTKLIKAALVRDGRIEVPFTLVGNLDDAGFSLNDILSRRIASGLSDALQAGGTVAADPSLAQAKAAITQLARENIKQQSREMVSGMLER